MLILLVLLVLSIIIIIKKKKKKKRHVAVVVILITFKSSKETDVFVFLESDRFSMTYNRLSLQFFLRL